MIEISVNDLKWVRNMIYDKINNDKLDEEEREYYEKMIQHFNKLIEENKSQGDGK